MTVSLSCEKADHAGCLRRSCSCYCGHPGRLSEAERDATLEAAAQRPRNRAFVASSEVEKPRREPTLARAPKAKVPKAPRAPRIRREPAPPIERPCRADQCTGTVTGHFSYCAPCREERSIPRSSGPARLALPVDEMAARYRAGEGLVELGEAYGISSNTVRKRLLEVGVTMRPRSSVLKLPIEEIIERYAAGEGLAELGAAYSRSPWTIRQHLVRAGVTIREAGRNNHAARLDLPINELTDAYEGGMRLVDVAERFGVGTGTVRDRLIAAGVTIRPRRWKALPEHELKARYEAGEPSRALAEDYGVDEGTIRAHLRRFGVTIRPGGPERVELDLKELTRRYQAGEGTETLAEALGCSPQTVTRRLIKAGVELRAVGAKPNGMPKRVELNGKLDEAIRRYRLGWSLEDLGQEYGCSYKVIRDRLADAGVEIRAQGKRGDGIRR